MIIIPDIHGRTFWKDVVDGCENEDIIFLGDYLDSYGWENISSDDAINNFLEIIKFKREHMNNVTLLLGNHDVHYLKGGFTASSRRMKYYYFDIREIFEKNEDLFQLVKQVQLGDKKFVFSHAGLTSKWLKENYIFGIEDAENIEEVVKYNYEIDKKRFISALNHVGSCRGGLHPSGSLLWADVSEHLKYEHENTCPFYQIFGHSQQEANPIVRDKFACLDCRRAFRLDEEGYLCELDGTIIK